MNAHSPDCSWPLLTGTCEYLDAFSGNQAMNLQREFDMIHSRPSKWVYYIIPGTRVSPA